MVFRSAASLVLIAAALAQCGCAVVDSAVGYGFHKSMVKEADAKIDRLAITHIRTPEYDAAASKLNLSAREAAEVLVAHRLREEPRTSTWPDGRVVERPTPTVEAELRHHRFLVGNEYLFSWGKEKFGVSLDGYYVDGMTGRVERRNEGYLYSGEMARRGWPGGWEVPDDWVYEPPGKQLLK